MAQRALEDLRQKLLARLDALNKKRGQFQDLNSFIEFRNAAGVQKGKSVDLNGFRRALKQFDCPGRHDDRIVRKAFSTLTRQDQNSSTNDKAITFNHVSQRHTATVIHFSLSLNACSQHFFMIYLIISTCDPATVQKVVCYPGCQRRTP